MVKPESTQATTMPTDSCAMCGVPSQSTGCLTRPTFCRTSLRRPSSMKMVFQTNPTITPEITCGRNAMVRSTR